MYTVYILYKTYNLEHVCLVFPVYIEFASRVCFLTGSNMADNHSEHVSPEPEPVLSANEEFCKESVQHFIEADTSGGSVPDETQKRFEDMIKNRTLSSELQDFVMSAEAEANDPRPLRQRNPGISRVFAHQSELDVFRYNVDARHSILDSDKLLNIVTKVSCIMYVEIS